MIQTTRSILTFAVLFTALLSFSSCEEFLDDIYKGGGGNGDSTQTIVEIAQDTDDLSTLVEALSEADLVDALSGEGPFTVFAPDNDAFHRLFQALGVSGVSEIDSALLSDVLLYHVVPTRALAADLQDGQEIETLQGESVTVTLQDDKVLINGIEVKVADIMASNGVIHVIEDVLLPPSVTNPTDSASVTIASNDSLGHILADGQGNTLYLFTPDTPGKSACVDGCLERWPAFYDEDLTVVEGLDADDFGTIERPDGSRQTTYRGWPLYFFAGDNEPGDVNGEGVGDVWFTVSPDVDPLTAPSIVEIAQNDERFSLLVEALVKAELVDALSEAGPFTVFAPTNDAFEAAFEALGVSGVDDLTAEQLTPILLYHVVGEAAVFSGDLSDGQQVTTLAGADVTVSVSDEGIKINDAQVVVPDVAARNGVIHAIDQVLLPPADGDDNS